MTSLERIFRWTTSRERRRRAMKETFELMCAAFQLSGAAFEAKDKEAFAFYRRQHSLLCRKWWRLKAL